VEAGLSVSPFAAIMSRRNENTVHYRAFTRKETATILEALKAHPYWQCLSMIALHTGLRLESCQRLRKDMIKDGMITIMPGKTARFGRAVQIPVTKTLAEYLATITHIGSCTPFCEQFTETRHFYVEGVRMGFFAGLLKSIGIHDNARGQVGFHSWRETYVTRLSEANVPEKIIRGIVGHNSQQMTDLYNHDTESVRRQAENIENALK